MTAPGETRRDRLLPISALQHLAFCPRQCALIHVEGIWAENRLTVEGAHLHRVAHDGPDTSRHGRRTTRGMEIVSRTLGLAGRADVVEFSNDGPPRPVEYKRGRPKRHDADRIQVAAQAICLEEMLGMEGRIREADLYYGKTKRRVRVAVDDGLRARVVDAAERLHELVEHGITPSARREPKCERCSLLDLCLPDALRPRATARRYIDLAVEHALADGGAAEDVCA